MQTEKISEYLNVNRTVKDAYEMLASNIRFGSEFQAVKILAIASGKPGTGKTTLAVNLAGTMAAWGKKTLLIDADIRKPTKVKLLDGETIRGLSDYLQGQVELEKVLCKTGIENFHYLTSGKNTSVPMELFCSDTFEGFLKDVKNRYAIVIIDTPSLSSVADGSLIAARSDAVLLVTKTGRTKLYEIKKAKEQLEKVNANLLGVVLNRAKKDAYKKYFTAYNYLQER